MLSDAQKDRLQSLHAYEWADDDPDVSKANLDAIFSEIDSHEELWYASFIVQWDVDDGSLDRILDHSLCDRGIALFIYWLLDPVSVHRSNDTHRLVLKLEGRFAKDHYPGGLIAFSPTDSPNWCRDQGGVPDKMLESTMGTALDFDYRSAVFGT